MSGISRLMQGPGSLYSESFDIDFPNGFAKSQDRIEFGQIEFQDLLRPSVRAMMGIVKKSPESQLVFHRQQGIYYFWMIPFVNQDDVGVVQLLAKKIKENGISAIYANIELGESLSELIKSLPFGGGPFLSQIHS
jgi:hypothetical protein